MARRTRRQRGRRRARSSKRRVQRGGGPGAPAPAPGAPTPNPLFTEAYAITMPEFPERFKAIKAHADKASLPLQPWKGVKVTPKDIDGLPPQGVGTTHFKDRTGKTFNLGVIGAFLAHRALLKNQKDKPGGTLIFEDDVVIPPDFYQKLAAVTAEVPADWDYLFLDKFKLDADKVTDHIYKVKKDPTAQKSWGIWAYIVKNASISSKILPTMEFMLDVPDIQLNYFADKLNMYVIQPSIVSPDPATAPQSVVSKLDVQ